MTLWICGLTHIPYYGAAMGVIFITHFLQDRTNFIPWWMTFVGSKDFMKPPLGPWSIIVVDQVWHLVVLAFVCRFLLD